MELPTQLKHRARKKVVNSKGGIQGAPYPGTQGEGPSQWYLSAGQPSVSAGGGRVSGRREIFRHGGEVAPAG